MYKNILNKINSGLENVLNEEKLEETKFTKNGLAKHYAKHVDHEMDPIEDRFENMEPYEYDNNADLLSQLPAGPSTSEDDDIVGFIAKDGTINKYRKSTQELVVYKPEGPTTTYYKASLASYNRKLKNQYLKELPENE